MIQVAQPNSRARRYIMKEKITQVVAAVVLGIIFSSGVALIESNANSFANDENNMQIQPVDRLNVDPPYPPPPPPPPPGGGLTE